MCIILSIIKALSGKEKKTSSEQYSDEELILFDCILDDEDD